MKLLFKLFFFFTVLSSYAQEPTWNIYKLDSLVSFQLPFNEVYQHDTILRGKRLFQLFATNEEGTSFLAQRVRLEKEGTDPNLSSLPYDSNSLIKSYSEIIKGISEQSQFEIITQEKITIDSKIAYHIELGVGRQKKYVSSILILDKYLYSFVKLNYNGLETSEDYFFDSIKLNSDEKITQFNGTSQGYRIGYLVGKYFFYILIATVIIIFIKRSLKIEKSKINS